MAMTRDCKSLAFGLRRFESYFQHHDSRGVFFCELGLSVRVLLLTPFLSHKNEPADCGLGLRV